MKSRICDGERIDPSKSHILEANVVFTIIHERKKAQAKNTKQNKCKTLLPLQSCNWSINESPASVWQRYFYVSLKELAVLQIGLRGHQDA